MTASAQTPPSVPQGDLAVIAQEGLLIPQTGGRVVLRLSRALAPTDGQLSVIFSPLANRLQKRDLTAQTKFAGDSIEIDFSSWPLNLETYEIRTYITTIDGRTLLIGTMRMQVVADSAVLSASADPTQRVPFVLHMDVGVSAQLAERTGGSQRPSDRVHFADLTLQGSAEANAGGDDWEARAQVQLVGSSFRQTAPTFSRLGAHSPKLDIASYIAEAAWRDSRLNVGHISVDAHPLLLTGINNRGIAFVQRLAGGVDLGVTAQNGESIAGYRNLVGLAERNNQFRSVGLGYDIYPEKPGYFRVDVNAVDARVINRGAGPSPAGTAPAPDQSRGAGGRLLWRNELNTLRVEGIFASSRFQPGVVQPNFPSQLDGTARTLEAGYDVIKDKILVADLKLSIALAARHEHASPFYRSLGSGFQSNYDMNIETLTARAGSIVSQIQLTQRYDNVDKNRVYIRNRVQGSAFAVTLPIASFLIDDLKLASLMPAPPSATPAEPTPAVDSAGGAPTYNPGPVAAASRPLAWVPAVTFAQQYTHGFGDHDFVPAGYGISDLPDVYIVNRAIGLQWQFERVTFGARATRTTQSNRQPGFAQQSTWDRRYSLNADWRVTDALTISMAYDPTYNFRFDTNARTDARQLRGSLNWTIDDKCQLTAEMNHSADYDSLDTRYNRQNVSQIQVTRRFTVPVPGWKSLPGQTFIRVADSRGFNYTRGSAVLEPTVRRIQMGLTLSIF